ncbi:MAG: DUF3883 domain-containing protein [Planctomycetota bacterium]|nr:DUF3883 domain-containing protein [Planctomycetota bacterium]
MMGKPNFFRLETQALVIGYAMSRLDQQYLKARGCRKWKDAFEEAAESLGVKPTSVKLLRDEFDPFHSNMRKGWHKRDMLPSRQRVLDELSGLSDEGVSEIVTRILKRDEQSIEEAIDSLADVSRTSANVAERLLTGRRAEDYFLKHCDHLISYTREEICDARLLARGYDFGLSADNNIAIEVKGLKQLKGDVLFTDREWAEARIRRSNYWLVIITGLSDAPRGHVIVDPHTAIQCKSEYRTSVTVSWRAKFDAGARG